MMHRLVAAANILVLALTVTLGGCHRSPGASDSEDDSAAIPASAVSMAVSAAKATVAPMHSELQMLGTTVAARQVQLRASMAGRLLDYNLQNGDRVRRGEVVAHIINREIEAAINGLAVAQQLDPAEAPALAQSVRRYSGGGGVAVIAPAGGIVSQRLVSSGQMVNEMDPLAELIDPHSVYVEAAVPIDNLASIRAGMEATVTSPMIPGVALPARVAALSPSLSPNGATSPARVEFTGDARITEAGAPVEISVTIGSAPDAIVIPVAALFADAGTGAYYVFVAGGDGRAHRVAVTIGVRRGGRVQVTSGVRAGDLVITSGGYALADGLNVKVTVASR
jgi:membrane fusion protein (multidrug efflux system)